MQRLRSCLFKLAYHGVGALTRGANQLLLRPLRGATNRMSRAVRRIDLFRIGHLRFDVQADDIFIVTYPRSGTTILQMMLYQLSSDGSMDFVHISQYCPWFEHMIAHGHISVLETLSSPRIFKSHLSYRWIPKGGARYIYVVRDGKDVAVSYFHLLKSHGGYTWTFDEFFERFLHGKVPHGSWFEHVDKWLANPRGLRMLVLTYEELQTDLEAAIRRVARFCEFKVDEQRIQETAKRCSIDFMKQHEVRFAHLTELLWLREAEGWGFIGAGGIGSWHSYMATKQAERFDRKAQAHIVRSPSVTEGSAHMYGE